MRIVQFVQREGTRSVGVVDGSEVVNLTATFPEYETTRVLALDAIHREVALVEMLDDLLPRCDDRLSYDDLWNGEPDSDLYLLPPLNHPDDSRTYITGTGLTHTGSMQSRDQMHAETEKMAVSQPDTDSAKMFQMGVEGGKPEADSRGTAPEWFYKGNGVCLRGHRAALDIPSFALDGGEEPEFVGCYVNGPGESKAAHVGLTGASPKSLIYIDGSPDHKVDNDGIINHLEKMVRQKVKEIKTENKKIITKS